MGKKLISASEVSEFSYCPYKWYYLMKYGKETLKNMSQENLKNYKANNPNYNNLQKGIAYHRSFNKKAYTLNKAIPINSILIFLSIVSMLTFHINIALRFILLFCLLIIINKIFSTKKEQSKIRPSYEGEVVYMDNSTSPIEGLLSSFTYGLCGKPDDIQKLSDGTFYPVEIKSGENNSGKPYYNDKMQLACYFILTEKNFGPCHVGVIQYRNCSYQIENSSELKNKLTNTLSHMHYSLRTGNPPQKPKYVSKNKCYRCNCKYTVCEIYNN